MKPKHIFGISFVAMMVGLLVAWKYDPNFTRVPTPKMTVYFAIFGFVMSSLLIFGANMMLALSKGKKAKSEEELEAIVAPAINGQEYDPRILKWTEIPRAAVCGAFLGTLLAAGIHYFVK